jgi:hypothetical protein
MAAAGHRHATIIGDGGGVETSYSNHAPEGGSPLALRLRRGVVGNAPFETIEVPCGNGFRRQAESFAHMVRLGAEQWNGATEAESIDTALSLDAAQSLRTDRWIEVRSKPTMAVANRAGPGALA